MARDWVSLREPPSDSPPHDPGYWRCGPRRQFGLAVLAFEGIAAIGQGQPGNDGLLVAADDPAGDLAGLESVGTVGAVSWRCAGPGGEEQTRMGWSSPIGNRTH